ncbi:hypothetical protein PLANPX_2788 [Lacipirellula parvula]|uniref:Uncharacterized protein n=1 Tax=Lacipirellula parvula TaxID=2650471 RepID=A0A5K7XFQ5_9BACT|nr:hypothetical protein PLANPX_2788 [Lacipirellula parvula]
MSRRGSFGCLWVFLRSSRESASGGYWIRIVITTEGLCIAKT